jgi:uncharacterized protein YggE
MEGRHGRVESRRDVCFSGRLAAHCPYRSVGLFFTTQAQAQQVQTAPEGRVIVTGEGDVAVAPDHAEITSGVTTRAKSVKERRTLTRK